MAKYKIGIIGCGKIAEVRHVPEYAANPKCELAAFFDVDISRAQAMADQYGGTAGTMHVIFANEISAHEGKEVEIPYNMVDFLQEMT